MTTSYASPRPQPSRAVIVNLVGFVLFVAGVAAVLVAAWAKDPLLGLAVSGAGVTVVGWRLATSEPRKV